MSAPMEVDANEMGSDEYERSANAPPSDVQASSGPDPSTLAVPCRDSAVIKRRAIQAIVRDPSLSDFAKRVRIQQLMDGRPNPSNSVSSSSSSAASDARSSTRDLGGSIHLANNDPVSLAEQSINNCGHYRRNCAIVAPCCNRLFGCHVCHDEIASGAEGDSPNVVQNNGAAAAALAEDHARVDRFGIREIVCKQCRTRQDSKRSECIQCNIRFGEYHCAQCNLWMEQSRRPFHCVECGFCRVGGRENYRHCEKCCMCISSSIFTTHNCMTDKYKNNCPVCREDMFSSRQAAQDLPCGHAIHSHCFRKLTGFDYRCPICKKTVMPNSSMDAAWAERARDIERQPMPPDLRRMVNIMCNDCEAKSTSRNWHYLGVQCTWCRSFNTIVECVLRCEDASAMEGGESNGAAAQQGDSAADG